MFTKRAQFPTFGTGRGGRSAAPGAACNDNHPLRRPAADARRMPRRALACRWRQAPTGGLECIWHIATAEASASEEPGIGWPIVRALPPLGTRPPVQQPFGIAAVFAEPRQCFLIPA